VSAPAREPQPEESGAGEEKVGFRDPYTVYVMGAMLLVYIISYIDRQLMAVLLQDIKLEFGLTDGQMGMLTGIAFAVAYSVVGLPVARLADRTARRTVIAVGVVVWSAITALTGAVQNFAQLFVARLGVGAAESAGGPPGHSLLADYFPPHQRGRALALYSAGGSVGIMLGMWIGGILGQEYGWRAAFMILGVPGLVVALLIRFTVREPPRGRFDVGHTPESEPLSVTAAYLWQRRAFVWLTLAATLHVFAGFGASTWNATFLRRVHGLTSGEAGFWLGPVSGISSFVGGLAAGWIADHFGRRDARWYMWVPIFGSLLAMPCSYAFLLWPTVMPAVLFLIPSAFFGNSHAGVTFAMAQSIARPRMRAMAAAIVLFIMNVGGLGAGPWILGMLSDYLGPRFGDESIRVALMIIALPHLAACVLNVIAARTLREDLAAAQRA
jgi:predicted MFS family arabinose efflux permease